MKDVKDKTSLTLKEWICDLIKNFQELNINC